MDLNASLERISELTPEELTALKEKVIEDAKAAKELYETSKDADSVATLTSLGQAATAIREEEGRRAVEAEELEAQVEAASAVIEELAAKKEDKEEELPVEEEPVVIEELPLPEEEILEPEPEVDIEVEPEPVVEENEDEDDKEKGKKSASVEENETAVAAVKETEKEVDEEDELPVEKEKEEASEVDATVDLERTNEVRPESADEADKPAIIAAGSSSAYHRGDEIPNIKALANAMVDTRGRVRNTAMSNGERDYVASLKLPEMESRHLYGSSLASNSQKINDVIVASATGSLTAAGGLYGPIADYDQVFEFEANVVRPVKAGLPGFRADRGGIRYYSPTLLKDLAGAASIWTLDDDVKALDPANNLEKPSLRIEAGTPVEALVDAVPLSLTFGNIGNQFYSEIAERHIKVGMQWHARVAEQHLLTRIAVLSTWAKTTQKLGFARDLFVNVETAAAGYRSRNRLGENAQLKAIFPHWVKNAIRADLAMQLPGDSTFSIGDSEIEGWFNDRNISVIFSYDGESTQYFGAQTDTAGTGELITRDAVTRIETLNPAARVAGALAAFPAELVWYLFMDGTFLFLDGGELDLGIVRDSTLNKTNDYQMFLETFEGVAKVGPESLRISTPVKITGASSGTVDVA